jgi:hypothetical protein
VTATLYLYGRPGCHLCDAARAAIDALQRARSLESRPTASIVERSIEDDPAWERAFHLTIPVLECAGRRLEIATSPAKIRAFLEEALDGAPEAPPDGRVSC